MDHASRYRANAKAESCAVPGGLDPFFSRLPTVETVGYLLSRFAPEALVKRRSLSRQ
jgi:hypothetical protein